MSAGEDEDEEEDEEQEDEDEDEDEDRWAVEIPNLELCIIWYFLNVGLKEG